MFIGSPTPERPDHDDEPARAASDDEDDRDDSDGLVNRVATTAKKISEIIAPFTGLAASIVHLISIHQAIKKL